MTLIVLVEQTQETLLKDRGGKRVREDDDTIRRARQRLHLLQTDLIETSGKEIDDMTIVGGAFAEGFVELSQCG